MAGAIAGTARQPFVRTVVPHGPSRCRIEFARRCPSESHQHLPQFPREPNWLLIPRRWVSGVLPRIRRSPCETESAAMKRGCKGTVALMAGARPSETRVGWRPFIRERPLRTCAQRYGSHRRRAMKAGALIEPTRARHSPTQGHPTVVGIDRPPPQSPLPGTLWDGTASHATVTGVTGSIQADRGQRTPRCSRIRL